MVVPVGHWFIGYRRSAVPMFTHVGSRLKFEFDPKAMTSQAIRRCRRCHDGAGGRGGRHGSSVRNWLAFAGRSRSHSVNDMQPVRPQCLTPWTQTFTFVHRIALFDQPSHRDLFPIGRWMDCIGYILCKSTTYQVHGTISLETFQCNNN